MLCACPGSVACIAISVIFLVYGRALILTIMAIIMSFDSTRMSPTNENAVYGTPRLKPCRTGLAWPAYRSLCTYDSTIRACGLEENRKDVQPRPVAVDDTIPLYDADEPDREGQPVDVECQLPPCVVGEVTANTTASVVFLLYFIRVILVCGQDAHRLLFVDVGRSDREGNLRLGKLAGIRTGLAGALTG